MAALVFCAVLLFQVGYFAFILQWDQALAPSGAVVVFDGSQPRVVEGYALMNRGLAQSLVVSPAGVRQLARYDKAYGFPGGAEHRVEDKARTTFENALLTSRIIIKEGWRDVILVTHGHHMPRSYFLLRLMLAGCGVKVRQSKVEFGAGWDPSFSTRMKIYYNEMTDMWGSLGEWALYAVRGRLPVTGNADSRVLRFLKRWLQFDVEAQRARLSRRGPGMESPCCI